MNWEDLAAKKVPAPFKPVIRDQLDVSNFAEEFTEMDPTYSPAALPNNCDRIFQVRFHMYKLYITAATFWFKKQKHISTNWILWKMSVVGRS